MEVRAGSGSCRRQTTLCSPERHFWVVRGSSVDSWCGDRTGSGGGARPLRSQGWWSEKWDVITSIGRSESSRVVAHTRRRHAESGDILDRPIGGFGHVVDTDGADIIPPEGCVKIDHVDESEWPQWSLAPWRFPATTANRSKASRYSGCPRPPGRWGSSALLRPVKVASLGKWPILASPGRLGLTPDFVEIARNEFGSRSSRRRLKRISGRFGVLGRFEHNHAHTIAFTVVQPRAVVESSLRLGPWNDNFLQHALAVLRRPAFAKLHPHHYSVSHLIIPFACHIKRQSQHPRGFERRGAPRGPGVSSRRREWVTLPVVRRGARLAMLSSGLGASRRLRNTSTPPSAAIDGPGGPAWWALGGRRASATGHTGTSVAAGDHLRGGGPWGLSPVLVQQTRQSGACRHGSLRCSAL
jgi:hypothetical protein